MLNPAAVLASRVPTDRAKVLVVGESGVGKSLLCHRLCHGMDDTDRPPELTNGCRVDVVYLSKGPTGQPALVELWDVSGLQGAWAPVSQPVASLAPRRL